MVVDAAIAMQGVKPETALAYFRHIKDRSFAVAGLAKRDMISDLHSSLYAAMNEGKTFAQWRASIPQILQETGWTGHRLETIFRTNVQTAYNAGRYAKMREVAKSRPYWQYLAVCDDRTRPAHAALNGMVFPADHEFWDSHYPPNGFRCRCTVRSLSKRQVDKQDLAVQEDIPQDLLYTDPKTGMEIPVASVAPDPGFAANPGKNWLDGLAPSELAGLELHDLAHAKALEKGVTPPLISLPAKHILPIKAGDILPAGLTDSAYMLAFFKEFGLQGLDEQFIHRLPGVGPLVVDRSLFLDKVTGALKANKANRGPYLKLLARTILDPYEIWLVPATLAGRQVASLRLIRLFEGANKEIGGFGVFALVGNSWTGSTVYNPMGENAKAMLAYLERQRTGTLVYREK